MSDNKKYYYLKLKDNFFDTDAMVILEGMQDGHLYSNILLKLYLRSLKHNGKLMYNERIPYSPSILASVTRHHVAIVEKALTIFKELDLIEILGNGAIYMLDIQNFIGKSSSEADRKRIYRNHIETEKQIALPESGQTSGQTSDKSPPEIELELELELELDIEIEKEKDIVDQIQIDDLPSEPKPKSETVQLFEYYLEVGLVNHKKLTDSMKKAAKKAFKDFSLDELKVMLDRHKQVAEYTESQVKYVVKKRTFAEFFGQKVKDAVILICEEYADNGPKWSHYKGVIENGTGREQDNAISKAVQGITRKQHNDEGEDYGDLL